MSMDTLSWRVIICFVLLLVFAISGGASARKILAHSGGHEVDDHEIEVNDNMQSKDHMDPSAHIFFTINDLKIGKRTELYFSYNDPSTSPHLLSKEEANSIPFSSTKLLDLLELFSIPKDSPQAEAIETTLKLCEVEPIIGETKNCATSLESMLDFVVDKIGPTSATNLKVLTSNLLRKPILPFQNYTILEEPKEIFAPTMIGCHTMPYPYVVYYCHGELEGGNKNTRLFEVLFGGENGGKIQAIVVCHADNSHWNRDHVSFSLLKVKQGTRLPICHVIPLDDIVWVPSLV